MNLTNASSIVYSALKVSKRTKTGETRRSSTLADLGVPSLAQIELLKLRIASSMNNATKREFSKPVFLAILELNRNTTFGEATSRALEAFDLAVGPQDYHCTGVREHGFSAAAARRLKYRCPLDRSKIVSD